MWELQDADPVWRANHTLLAQAGSIEIDPDNYTNGQIYRERPGAARSRRAGNPGSKLSRGYGIGS